jgi:hypothetical protein
MPCHLIFSTELEGDPASKSAQLPPGPLFKANFTWPADTGYFVAIAPKFVQLSMLPETCTIVCGFVDAVEVNPGPILTTPGNLVPEAPIRHAGVAPSGSTSVKNCWLEVSPGVSADTRTWQLRQSDKPLTPCIGAWFGDRQLNRDCGLSPLNTFNRSDESDAGNVAIPAADAWVGLFPEAMSQCSDAL